jgi:hypothetical protein
VSAEEDQCVLWSVLRLLALCFEKDNVAFKKDPPVEYVKETSCER